MIPCIKTSLSDKPSYPITFYKWGYPPLNLYSNYKGFLGVGGGSLFKNVYLDIQKVFHVGHNTIKSYQLLV